jgi:small subunit ribosomal protein S18
LWVFIFGTLASLSCWRRLDRRRGGGRRGGDGRFGRGAGGACRLLRRGGGGGRFGRRRVCAFCVDKIEKIDYKDPGKLRRYISDRGKIEPRRKTGTCAGHQRMLTIALKRARHVALLPFTAEHIHVTGVFPSRG